jgi:hypothetical protein
MELISFCLRILIYLHRKQFMVAHVEMQNDQLILEQQGTIIAKFEDVKKKSKTLRWRCSIKTVIKSLRKQKLQMLHKRLNKILAKI